MTTTAGTSVLVTGATGFVGSSLLPALVRHGDLRIRAMVRPTSDVSGLDGLPVERVETHLRDDEGLRRAVQGSDIVVHLAALTRAPDEAAFRDVNVEGTRRLVEAIRHDGRVRRLVYLSSMAAAGPARDGRPVAPDDEPSPVTAYGRSKLDGEGVARGAGPEVSVVVLRPPAIYGPRDRDLLTFFRLARWRILPAPTGRNRQVELIHVGDVARALVRAAFAENATGVYHIAGPRAYAWNDVLDLVAAAVGRRGWKVPLPGPVVRMAGRVNGTLARMAGGAAIFDRDKARELLASWLCDTTAARRDLGFTATKALEQGLKETAAWYRAYGWLG